MEQELNIAEILKDKPKGLKLWSPIIGDCELSFINSIFDIIVTVKSKIFYNGSAIYSMDFDSKGKYGGEFEGNTIERECVLFPSKFMRDWSKFAWKKGDVLVSNGVHIIFEKWKNNSYTTFLGVFDSIDNNSLICLTSVWEKETNEVQINKYISQIEKDGGGKLNLSTLEIEKPSKFKDGDIVFYEDSEHEEICSSIFIFRGKQNHTPRFLYHAVLASDGFFNAKDGSFGIYEGKLRPATDSEKQQLFDALAKENKTWDAEKKQIVDLPKKCEFKAFDKVLVRCKDYQKWKVDFFSHYDDSCKGFPYVCVSSRKSFCIPYNDQTAHLLGTTDDWEGGEE